MALDQIQRDASSISPKSLGAQRGAPCTHSALIKALCVRAAQHTEYIRVVAITENCTRRVVFFVSILFY